MLPCRFCAKAITASEGVYYGDLWSRKHLGDDAKCRIDLMICMVAALFFAFVTLFCKMLRQGQSTPSTFWGVAPLLPQCRCRDITSEYSSGEPAHVSVTFACLPFHHLSGHTPWSRGPSNPCHNQRGKETGAVLSRHPSYRRCRLHRTGSEERF